MRPATVVPRLAALLLSSLVLTVSCGPKVAPESAATAVPAGTSAAGRLVIAHTNDLHAHYLPEVAGWRDDQGLLGGMVSLSARLGELDATHGQDAVLYLDAGDLLSGTPLMELEVDGVQGGGMARLLDAVGVDAWVMGNHEFDRGFAHANAFSELSQAAVLTANLRAPCGTAPLTCDVALPGATAWQVFDVNGMKVGVFGLTTSGLGHLTDEQTMRRITVVSHQEAAQAAVAALEPQVDLVVALTHIGLEQDRLLAQEVTGIDVIVGGHSHTRMEAAEKVGETWIVQAGSYGRLLGVAQIEVVEGAVSAFDWTPEELTASPAADLVDPQVQALVDDYRSQLDARFSVAAGSASQALTRGYKGETPLGRWSADVVRVAAEADVGLYNAGGIRADLPAGDLTVGDLYTIFPFGNEVVWFELTGQELLGIMLSTAGALVEDNRGTLQWSGVRFSFQVRLGAPEIVSAEVGGKPLDLAATYRVATNSFVAAQWKRNLGVKPGQVHSTGGTVLEAAVALARQAPVTDPLPARMTRVGSGSATTP